MKKGLLLFSLIIFFSCGNEAERHKNDLRISDLESQVNELAIVNDSLQKELELLKSRNPVVYTEGFDSLDNPEAFITEALEKDSTLIPAEGVLGGKMYFTGTEILNERFIWAEYEDGHIQGSAIFSYKMGADGRPAFKLISQVKE